MSYTFGFCPKTRTPPPTPVIPRSRFPVPVAPKGMVRRNLTLLVEPPPPPKGMSRQIHSIVVDVAAKHKVTVPLIMGETRDKRVVAARHEVWWRVWRTSGLSYPRIGAMFHRDHTTILHGVKQYQKRVDGERGALA